MRKILIITVAAFVLLSGFLYLVNNPNIVFSYSDNGDQSTDVKTVARNVSSLNRPSTVSAGARDQSFPKTAARQDAGSRIGTSEKEMDKPAQRPVREQDQSLKQDQNQKSSQSRQVESQDTQKISKLQTQTKKAEQQPPRQITQKSSSQPQQERRASTQQSSSQTSEQKNKKVSSQQTTQKPKQTQSQDTANKSGQTQQVKHAKQTQQTKQTQETKQTQQTQKTEQTKQTQQTSATPVIDTSGIKSGYVGVKYKKPDNKRYKVLIEKDGQRYAYDLTADGKLEKFPLQMGDGKYKIRVMQHVDGSQYRTIHSETIEVKTSGKYDAYLSSVKMIKWDNSMAAIKTAKKLTANSSNDMDKVKKIYNYVVSNIKYDAGKLGKLPSNYVPSIKTTFSTKKGICYDFSSLFAGMLRSVGIPTKLVKGYAAGVEGYHAWNEVYIESKGKWVVIDTSYDAQMKAAGKKTSMIKDKSAYTKKKEY
ncbi:MAG TPA: hypothetical protein GXZ32_05980 [Clostridiales bacterium]|nr:hypothetical protein [Clostridiales bacterium]